MNAIQLKGDPAYVGSGRSLFALDITDRNNFTRFGGIGLGSTVEDVEVRHDFACLAAGRTGIHVVSIADPAVPVVVGNDYSPAESRAMDKLSDPRYVVAQRYGVTSIHVGSSTVIPLASLAGCFEVIARCPRVSSLVMCSPQPSTRGEVGGEEAETREKTSPPETSSIGVDAPVELLHAEGRGKRERPAGFL